MRDRKRIKPFLEKIEEEWNLIPDWRFGQFMVNFLGQLPRDPFFYEDNELLEELDKFMEPYKMNAEVLGETPELEKRINELKKR